MALRIVDPNHAFREAHREFDRTPTVENRIRLGNAILDHGGPEKVVQDEENFEQAAQGTFARDPTAPFGLARAQYANRHPEPAHATLTALFAAHSASRTEPRPALFLAETMAALNHPDARDAFNHAVMHCDDASARCRFAQWLASKENAADHGHARELFQGILHDAKHWTRFARAHNGEWIKLAKLGLKAQ